MNKQRKRFSKTDAPRFATNEEKVLKDNDFIVSKTDPKGHITYCNEIFTDMCGYSADELMGANHNLIRHPDMPAIAFKLAWDLIKSGKEFFGFVKNLRKNGGYYWVFAYITPDYDNNKNIIGYTSIRRKPPQAAIDAISPVYEVLLSAEQRGGMQASAEILENYLKEHQITYNALVMNLQRGVL